MSTPTPKSTVKTSEPKPKDKKETTESSDDKKKRLALWIGASVAAVTLAVGIPILVKVCCSDDDEKEEEEKKVASSGAVLNKLVSWVKELTEGEHEENTEEEEKNNDKYVEVSSVVDFAKTQSM